MSDGMNGTVSADELLRVNIFPELIRASCSMYGAWGAALANSASKFGSWQNAAHDPRLKGQWPFLFPAGKLIHLRALDWGTDNPFVPHSLVTVYHPAAG